MVKFGPFCKRDNSPVVRGFGEVDYPLFGMIVWFTYLELKDGCLGAVVGAGSILQEGVGAMGVAGTDGLLLVLGEVVKLLDGTFDCLPKE